MIDARNIEDAAYVAEKALPAASATAYTDALDLKGEKFLAEDIEFVLYAEATPSLVDTKTVTYSVEQSDDGVTFAAHPDVASVVKTGAGGVGATAFTSRFKLPSGSKRYIRGKAVVLAAGGDNTAKKFGLKAKF